MALSSLVGGPLQSRFLQSLSKTAQALALLGSISLFVFSVLALLMTLLFSGTFVEPPEPPPAQTTLLLCVFVVAGGTLLLAAGWRYGLLRLGLWQLVLIALGVGVGLWFTLQQAMYQDACCMFSYQIVYGAPFPGLTRSIVLENPLSWDQVYQLLRQHPDQFTSQIAGPGMLADVAFYAHLTLIPAALLGTGLRLVRRLAQR
jgi:hypothetical protein